MEKIDDAVLLDQACVLERRLDVKAAVLDENVLISRRSLLELTIATEQSALNP